MSEPKKKLFLIITKGVWGGAQKYVFDLATHVRDTYDVTVVYGTEGLLAEKLREANIRTIHVESLGRDVNPLLDLKSFFILLKLFRKEKPDIIHLNSSKIGGLGALAGRMARIKKIIFTAHGWVFNENRSALSRCILWLLSWLTALFSTHIIVLGEKEKKQTLSMPLISQKKVSLIRLGIAPQDFLDKKSALQKLSQILKVPEDFFDTKIIIGTIAELTPNKGLTYAIDAIRELQDQNIVYIVLGTGELYQELKNQITRYNLSEKVFLAGFVANASQLLKAFDIFLISSIKEGLPYTLLEAGQAGIPIISTNVGNIPEIIINSETGLLARPHQSKELFMCIQMLIKNPDRATAIAQRFQDHVIKKMSTDMMVQHTADLYDF